MSAVLSSAQQDADQVSTAGRPSSYTTEIGEAICARLAKGESMRSICKDESMPCQATIYNWLASDKLPQFMEQYTRGREAQAECLAEEIIAIADDGQNDTYVDSEGLRRVDHDNIARSKLRVEARKWVAAKLLPKKYGDRMQVDHTGKVDVDITHYKTQLRQMLDIPAEPLTLENTAKQLPKV